MQSARLHPSKHTETVLSGVEDLLHAISASEMEPHFRAVGSGAERRGIRLERIYWENMTRIAADTGVSMADLVQRVARRFPDNGNLASLLRVVTFKWVCNRLESQEDTAVLENLGAIVHASPVPTLVMTRERRIMLFNEPFVNMLRVKFSIEKTNAIAWDLKFLIDAHIDEAIETLNAKRGSVIKTGFSAVLNGRTLRGKMNIASVPTQHKNMLIGYVSEA